MSIIAACLALSACATFGTRGNCAGDDWTRLRTPPSNAAQIRQLADDNPILNFTPRRELWFKTRAGDIALCRLSENTTPSGAQAGATWYFTRNGALVPNLEDSWVTTD